MELDVTMFCIVGAATEALSGGQASFGKYSERLQAVLEFLTYSSAQVKFFIRVNVPKNILTFFLERFCILKMGLSKPHFNNLYLMLKYWLI